MSGKWIGHLNVAEANVTAITARLNRRGLTIMSRMMTAAYSTASAIRQPPIQTTDPLQGLDETATQGIGEPVP
jgi:hypothetical protein